MNRIKIGICVFLLLVLSNRAPAQSHYNSWLRASFGIEWNPKLKTEIEYQHRRQSGPGNTNFTEYPLMQTIRVWLYHKVDAHLQLALSPFALFENYRLIVKKGDEALAPLREYRFSGAIDLQHELYNPHISIVNRSAVEYRIFEDNPNDIIRLRNKLGLKFALPKSVFLMAGDEIFFNIGGVSANHLFDHNRIFLMLECKPLSRVKIDAAFIHISRFPVRTLTLTEEENFVLNFAYTLVRHRK